MKELIDLYHFPEEYNFIEDTKAEISYKNQGNCNCSWSISSTTASSYRFHKKGINIDLSPQYPLSCYIKNCSYENYLIDTQLNLVKNGTVSEECLPFISKDQQLLDDCPSSCKNGSSLVKYYSQKAYSVDEYYSEENYYDIMLLTMDELIENGPIVAQLDLYQDLIEWNNNPEKCFDEVYKHKTQEEHIGKYYVTIVGYGYSYNKYYWLVQNSIGVEQCNISKLNLDK